MVSRGVRADSVNVWNFCTVMLNMFLINKNKQKKGCGVRIGDKAHLPI